MAGIPMTGPETGAADHDPATTKLLEVRITPHRSMSQRNVRVLVGLFAGVSIATSVPFIVMGAWPVAGFMGLDVAILFLAFQASFRAARAYEDVIVTPLELLLAKVSAEGRRREWRFHPAWVRIDKEEHVEFGLLHIAICSRGRRVEVAGFLGPDAKADFASDLTRALGEAKRGPRFS